MGLRNQISSSNVRSFVPCHQKRLCGYYIAHIQLKIMMAARGRMPLAVEETLTH